MSERTWEPMTADQKLTLARDIVRLIEERFPLEQWDGQADALVMAVQATTSVNFARTELFGCAN